MGMDEQTATRLDQAIRDAREAFTAFSLAMDELKDELRDAGVSTRRLVAYGVGDADRDMGAGMTLDEWLDEVSEQVVESVMDATTSREE